MWESYEIHISFTTLFSSHIHLGALQELGLESCFSSVFNLSGVREDTSNGIKYRSLKYRTIENNRDSENTKQYTKRVEMPGKMDMPQKFISVLGCWKYPES